MPGRQSHGSAPSKAIKAIKKSKTNAGKRNLDALAIASHQSSDNVKIRQSRLGKAEGSAGRSAKKRRYGEDQNEEDEEAEEGARGARSASKKQRKEKGRFDELDLDEGSDSEGNEWKMGQVDSDDDSDLDSDEAFGESDEERFEGFAFSGSSDKKGKSKTKKDTRKEVSLNEIDDEMDSDSELEEGDLGEDAVDLATMLDGTDEEEEEVPAKQGRQDLNMLSSAEDDDEEEEEEEEGDTEESSDEDSSASSADDDDSADPAKIAALQSIIAELAQTEDSGRAARKERTSGGDELSTPSDFALTARTKLTLADLSLPAINDPQIKKSLKFLESDPADESKRKAITKALEVPLARRQQDRLDRGAAYEKTKETLDRWTDTVKHNRRADHLVFPLIDKDELSAKTNTRLVSTTQSKPFNELEAAIQSILEESGLATTDGKDGEDKIREFEELKANEMSLEEVKARRAELRMARELLFREEAKAKRIKKIKSKSYRRVHRREREKEERQNREALEAGGLVPSDDEIEAQHRRRATERMGAKHRGSKWAKATKESGRAAWDEDARAGIADMARRDEELRKRVEGRNVRKDEGGDSEDTDSDLSDGSGSDSETERLKLVTKIKALEGTGVVNSSGPGSKLANMKFMLKAEAARKKGNDEMLEELRREVAGQEAVSEEEEDEDGDIGRRVFGPAKVKTAKQAAIDTSRNEFEEPHSSDDDAVSKETGTETGPSTKVSKSTSKKAIKSTSSFKAPATEVQQDVDLGAGGGAWSRAAATSNTISEAEATRRRHKKNKAIDVEELDVSKALTLSDRPKSKKKINKTSSALHLSSESEDSGDEGGGRVPFAIQDKELIKRAFAGADVVADFEAEKKQVAEEEEEKVIDNMLPGWGSWVGEGVSKRELNRNKGKSLTKLDGVEQQKRKDAKLAKVIINEKRVKKNVKYLASSLPHPFETRQQYERSLRLPVGPEWSTKQTFQEATKPRVLVKQGIIAPMAKPLL